MKLGILLIASLLAGCAQEINNSSIADGYRLCSDQGGLSHLKVLNDFNFEVWCMNGRFFLTRKLPTPVMKLEEAAPKEQSK